VSAIFQVVLPDLTRFDLNPNAALPSAASMGLAVLYMLLWTSGLLFLGAFIFRHRDLK